jgi:hypothetical protein
MERAARAQAACGSEARRLLREDRLAVTPRTPARVAELLSPPAFARLKDDLYRKNWVVYTKAPFNKPDALFRHLDLYMHVNARLVIARTAIEQQAHDLKNTCEDSAALPRRSCIGKAPLPPRASVSPDFTTLAGSLDVVRAFRYRRLFAHVGTAPLTARTRAFVQHVV